MKAAMKIENREYKLRDFLIIPFSVSPYLTLLRAADKVVYALIPSLQILATAKFIDTAINILNSRAQKNQIIFPLVCILLIIAHQYITFALMGLVRDKMSMTLTEAFRTAVTEKRARLEYRHIENNETWDLIDRVGKDPAGRLDGGFNIMLRMADMFFRVGSVMLVLAMRVWWAALVIAIFSIPLFYLAVKSGKTNYEASKEAAKHTRRAQYLQSVLTGRGSAEERSLFGYSHEVNKRYYEKYETAYKINMKSQRSRFIKMKSASLITVLISVLIAGVLIAPLGTGDITAGMFMGFVTSSFSLAQMMSWELTEITGNLANNREYLRDLTAFAKLSETPGASDLPVSFIKEPEIIEFRSVNFAYPGTEKLILKNFNLKLKAAKHYAFVGENGAGKTTITKLLTGLYDNYTGDILIDGRNLRDFTQAELKALFSVVYQDFSKYQIPIADSIGMGNVRSFSRQAVSEAAESVGLNEAVLKLPEGLDTPLGRIKENGVDISAGQWQRVAIARSLVSRAPVHILDEPTASLDPVAESEVYGMFGEISKGKSTVFITHRLGAARLADEILVIAGGCVAQQGSHAELIKMGGIYAEMFEAQRGWYAS
ncbi:MAG: ABC transporter ATP-binding protein/permease [Clostridiales bacterium]|jgi:ATP-binding cassette subfamily B protein|nr:ABC transporter ATP-binding protein/permease [Clostridiales bacterium]